MVIGMSEGDRYRFEVVLMSDGFIVRARAVETGEIFAARDRMFRTAPSAFAYAELSAMQDVEDTGPAHTLETSRASRMFDDIRASLADGGVSATLLAAWDRRSSIPAAPLMN